MAFQQSAYQTSTTTPPGPRAYQSMDVSELTLAVTAVTQDQTQNLEFTQDLTLSASAEFDAGGPQGVFIRIRVLARHPGRLAGFPTQNFGENDAVAEPVIFFHKDAQVSLDFTILNPDGTKYNLTGATVELLAQPERGATLTFSCSVLDGINGLARRTVIANDFQAGPYQAQIRVTNGAVVFHTVYFRILVGKAIE